MIVEYGTIARSLGQRWPDVSVSGKPVKVSVSLLRTVKCHWEVMKVMVKRWTVTLWADGSTVGLILIL